MRLPVRAATRLKALILILTAVFFAQKYVSGTLYDAIGPRFDWLAVVAVMLLILMAGAYDMTRPAEETEEGGDRAPGDTVSMWPLLIISLPLILGVAVPVARAGGGVALRSGWGALGAAGGPDLSGVLYASPTGGEEPLALWFVSPESGEQQEIFAPEFGFDDYDVSPDGTQLVMSVLNEDLTADLWVLSASGANPRRILDCSPVGCGSVAWSPDGSLLAYEREVEASASSDGLRPTRIWLYDVASGETAPLFEDEQVLGHQPVFSPDGHHLAFFDSSTRAIRLADLAHGSQTVIPSQMGEVGSFSPDGESMVYVELRAVGRQYYPELWLASFGEESSAEPLREDAEEDHYPAWSPDGRWIAFSQRLLDRSEGWASQLMLYEVETGEVRQVTDAVEYNHTLFKWSPSSERLLVQRFDLSQTYARPSLWLYDLEEDDMTLLVEDAANGQWLP